MICGSLLLPYKLGDFYVTNLTDDWVPVTAVVELTALVSPCELLGHHLVHLPKYLTQDDVAFQVALHDPYVRAGDHNLKKTGLFLARLPTLIGVFDGCNLYSAAELRPAGIGYLGIRRGKGRPTEALVEQVIRAFRAMDLAVANELSELIEDLNARYGTSFDRVEFTEVQRLAGACVTGCDIATPEPRSPFASTADYVPRMRIS